MKVIIPPPEIRPIELEHKVVGTLKQGYPVLASRAHKEDLWSCGSIIWAKLAIEKITT